MEVTPWGGGPTEKVDSDGDATIDALDTDSDNGGITDANEGVADLDMDGLANFRDADDDGDGILTRTEVNDALIARVSGDVDGDGLKNNDQGVLEGTGLRCAVSHASGRRGSWAVIAGSLGLALAFVLRSRRSRRSRDR